MPSYYLLHLSVLGIAIISQFVRVEQKRRKFLLITLGTLLVLYAGLRGEYSLTDTDSYYGHFQGVSDRGAFWDVPYERFEHGYLIFEKFFHQNISDDPAWLIFCVSLLVFTVVIYTIYKECENIWLAVFLYIAFYVYVPHICAVRQSLAMLLCFISFFCMKRKKIIFAVALIALASTFHTSAIVFYLVIPLMYLPVSRRTTLLAIIGALVLFSGLGVILEFMGETDSTYLSGDMYKMANYLSLLRLGIMWLFIYKFNENLKDKDVRMLYWMSIMVVVMTFLALKLTVLSRTADYFTLFIIILFVNSIRNVRAPLRSAICVFAIAIGMANAYVVYTYRAYWNHIDEYYTIFGTPPTNRLIVED